LINLNKSEENTDLKVPIPVSGIFELLLGDHLVMLKKNYKKDKTLLNVFTL